VSFKSGTSRGGEAPELGKPNRKRVRVSGLPLTSNALGVEAERTNFGGVVLEKI